MEKGKKNLRDELNEHRQRWNLLQKIPCSEQEEREFEALLKAGESLPEGVLYQKNDEYSETEYSFYTIYKPELTQEELTEYLTYKKLSLLNMIKNCVVFFTILTIVSIIAAIIIIT